MRCWPNLNDMFSGWNLSNHCYLLGAQWQDAESFPRGQRQACGPEIPMEESQAQAGDTQSAANIWILLDTLQAVFNGFPSLLSFKASKILAAGK